MFLDKCVGVICQCTLYIFPRYHPEGRVVFRNDGQVSQPQCPEKHIRLRDWKSFMHSRRGLVHVRPHIDDVVGVSGSCSPTGVPVGCSVPQERF